MKLEEFEAICEKATPADKWSSTDREFSMDARYEFATGPWHENLSGDNDALVEADAAFIAACRTMVPRMIKALKAAKECDEYLFDKDHFPLNQIGCRSQLHLQLSAALAELEQP